MKIGVFDSGIGGKSVANAIIKAFPEHEVIFRNDKKNVPYGTKLPDELFSLVEPIFQELVDEGCRVIVIACNTVSTTILDNLCRKFNIPLVALEPMIKPATKLTKTGVIAVCATPATLSSKRYADLKNMYANDLTILEPDCSDWAYMIEHSQIDERKIENRLNEVLNKNADVIVLGCTHYHWIEKEIESLSKNRAVILQPETAVVKQLGRVLSRLK